MTRKLRVQVERDACYLSILPHIDTFASVRIVPIELSIVVMQQPIHCKPRTFKVIRIVPSEFGLDDCSRCLCYFPYQPIPSIYLLILWRNMILINMWNRFEMKWNNSLAYYNALRCIVRICSRPHTKHSNNF